MRSSRRRQPRFESLESKDLLSVAGAAATTLVAQVEGLTGRRHLALNGSIAGSFSLSMGVPDVGAGLTLKGTGGASPLGPVKAAGALQMPGFILDGHATGTLTLSGSHGSVTLNLLGPAQASSSAAPATFTYSIASGTGRFLGASGSGTGTFQEVASQSPQPGASGMMTPDYIVASHFKFTLHAGGS